MIAISIIEMFHSNTFLKWDYAEYSWNPATVQYFWLADFVLEYFIRIQTFTAEWLNGVHTLPVLNIIWIPFSIQTQVEAGNDVYELNIAKLSLKYRISIDFKEYINISWFTSQIIFLIQSSLACCPLAYNFNLQNSHNNKRTPEWESLPWLFKN